MYTLCILCCIPCVYSVHTLCTPCCIPCVYHVNTLCIPCIYPVYNLFIYPALHHCSIFTVFSLLPGSLVNLPAFPEGCVWTLVRRTCVPVAECICMCSLSCLSQWPDVLRQWRRVCCFSDTKSRQQAAGRRARPSRISVLWRARPAPSWIIHPFGWSNAHIYYSFCIPGVKLPVQPALLWKPKGRPSLGSTLQPAYSNATLCNSRTLWRDLHKLNRKSSSRCVAETSVAERGNEFKSKLRFSTIL